MREFQDENDLPNLGKEVDETPLDSVEMDQTKFVKVEQAIARINLETDAPLTERNLLDRVHTEACFLEEGQPELDYGNDHDSVVLSSHVEVKAALENIESQASDAVKIGQQRETQSGQSEQYGVEAYRWVVLAMHSGLLLNAIIAASSYIFFPKLIEESFKENAYLVNFSILMQFLVVAPTSYVTAKMYNYLTHDQVLRIVATLEIAGVVLRMLATFDGNFKWIMAGQLPLLISLSISMNSVTQTANIWFAQNQKATAVQILRMGDPIGGIVTVLIQIIFSNVIESRRAEEGADTDQVTVDSINQMLTMEGMFTIVVALLAINLLRDKPRLPPSKSSCIERTGTVRVSNLKDDIGELFGNPNFRVFLFMNTIVVALYSTIGKVVVAMFDPYGITPSEIATFVFLNLMAGISTAMISGVWIDKTQKFKQTTTALLFLIVVSILFTQFALRTDTNTIFYIAGIVGGMVHLPLLPINFAYAAELTYPVRQPTVIGVMQTFSNFTSFVLGTGIIILTETFKEKTGANMGWAILSVLVFMAFVASIFIEEDLRLAKVNKKDDN